MAIRPLTHIPVIIIGGFLGAGKTTLVNSILGQAEGRRFVVFVNDFGAINIDYELIETRDENRISLKNGCVCCSLNDDLIYRITEFSQADDKPNAFIIEASGVADPRNLYQSIYALADAGIVTMECRIYLMDCEQFGRYEYEDAEILIDHAAASDLILLNKTDMADSKNLEKLKALLEISAPHSLLVETTYCQISMTLLLDTDYLQITDNSRNKPEDSMVRDRHMREYSSWGQQYEGGLERQKFDHFASQLPDHCFRAKAILHFLDSPKRIFKFNMVGRRATLESSPKTGIEVISSLVTIGKTGQFNRDELKRLWDQLIT